MKRLVKKAICSVLAMTLTFSLITGCGTEGEKIAASNTTAQTETKNAETEAKSENSVSEVKVTLPNSTGLQAKVEGEAVIATQVYLLARAYFEKLETYDMDNFDAADYSALLAETAEAFRVADTICGSFETHAGALAEAEEKESFEKEKAIFEQVAKIMEKYSPFVSVVYAAEQKSPAVKYAEELTQTFDNAKNGQKLKAVAEKYGTDVKKAKAMLDQAQAILEGAAYEDQAEFENKCYEAAVETKAACSAIGFGVAVAGVVATGGIAAGGLSATGLIEAGGFAFSGVSAVVDMGTAVTIHTTNGEGNEYTTAWEKTNEIMAPVSTIFAIGGGIGNIRDFRDPTKAAKAIDNAAQAFITGLGIGRDYVQDGTVMGVSANIIDGYKEIIIRSAAVSDKEAAKDVLLDTGITEEMLNQDNNEAASTEGNTQEGSLGAEADFYIEALRIFADPTNPFDVNAVIESVNQAFIESAEAEGIDVGEMSIPTTEEGEQPEDISEIEDVEEPADEQSSADSGVLPATEIVGTYAYQGADDVWTNTVTVIDSSHIKFTDDESAELIGSYDENTGVFFYSESYGDFSVSARAVFERSGNGIKSTMTLTVGDESVTSTAMKKER